MKYESFYKAFYASDDQGKKLYNDRFNNDTTFHLNEQIGNHSAFICCSFELMKMANDIYQLNNDIVELIKKSDLFEALNYYTLIEEIIMTNNIEGVISTRKEIRDLTAVNKPKKYLRFYGIVNKYRKIINDESFSPVQNVKDIRNLYDQMMLPDIQNTQPGNTPDGEIFRKDPVEVYSGTKAIHKGVMPESEIIRQMNEALVFLNDQEMPLLVRAAAFHYLFAYIHPFYDGNGRMNRYISSYYLSAVLNKYAALQLSVACKKNQKKYYDAFKITNDPRNRGDLTYFVLSFFEIMIDGMQSFKNKVKDQQEKYLHYSEGITKLNLTHTENEILETILQNTLFDAPDCTISDLADQIHKSSKTVSKYVRLFIKRGYISRIKIERNFSYSFNYDYFDFSR